MKRYEVGYAVGYAGRNIPFAWFNAREDAQTFIHALREDEPDHKFEIIEDEEAMK